MRHDPNDLRSQIRFEILPPPQKKKKKKKRTPNSFLGHGHSVFVQWDFLMAHKFVFLEGQVFFFLGGGGGGGVSA